MKIYYLTSLNEDVYVFLSARSKKGTRHFASKNYDASFFGAFWTRAELEGRELRGRRVAYAKLPAAFRRRYPKVNK